MKKFRKSRTRGLRTVFVLFLLFVVFNSLTAVLFYEEYRCKKNLLAEVAAVSETSEDGIDTAVSWLKGDKKQPGKEGKRLLEQYGYWDSKENVFYEEFKRNVGISGAAGAVICFLLLGVLAYRRKKDKADKENLLQHLEQILLKFRTDDFKVLSDKAEFKEDRLADQLEAIGAHIRILQENARKEKESTKEIVSDISHQLKTPVSALDACFTILLQENLSQEERKEFQQRCRSALDGLETLLQSLLQISKMEAGLIQIELKPCPVMDTISSAVSCVYPKADKKQIEFVFDYEKSMEKSVIMQDKKWLGEAFINVLDNAVKYSPDNSKIEIRLRKLMDFVRVEISDFGIGIPKEEYHKIFQRFYRGSFPEVKEENGSGIGLYLSRKVIEQHRGTITVNSDGRKKGSTFVIQLPVAF